MRNCDRWNRWGWSALALCGAAGAVDLPPPKVEQRVPVSVADLGITSRLSVDRIKTALLPGDEFGFSSVGMFCANRQPLRVTEEFVKGYGSLETAVATQLLKKYGYPMASLGSATAFNTDVAAAPDFRIGGIVKEIKLEVCRTGNEAEGWVYIKVDWALYAEKEQKVVFQLTTEGLANSSKKIPDLSRLAVVSTVENFIAAPGFLAAIKPDAAAQLAARPTGAAAPAPSAAPARVSGEPTVAHLTPVKATDQGLTVKLGVDAAKVALLPGDDLGQASSGAFCTGATPLRVSDGLIRNYGNFVGTVAVQALKRHGYPLASQGRTSAFDTEQAAPPDFRIGGIVKDLRMDVCNGLNTAEGWIYVKIDWALYSEKAKRVVFNQTTEGLAKSKDKVPDLPNRALTVSIENFLAAPELMAALKAAPPVAVVAAASAATAAVEPAASAASAAPPSAPSDGVRGLQLAGGAALPGGAQKNQARLRAAVVTLETARGSGSGFYIDREGYLLTNFHVVSGSKFVKVKLANGDKLVAQVVKVSERDDVALLKSVAVDLDPLHIRPDTLDVGEEVYAIGTPLGVLTSTMTRGVLSADRVSQGVHELQSDAAVTFGSSGGPLLDNEGRVIGLTKSGLRGEKGFNFFVPVHDALRALDVSVTKPR